MKKKIARWTLLVVILLLFSSSSQQIGSANPQEFQGDVEAVSIAYQAGLLRPEYLANGPQYVDCEPPAYGYNQGESFFAGTLALMNIPASNFALQAFMQWKPYENTAACWNPLATTYRVTSMPPGTGCTATNFNSVPVQNYSSEYCGELATARTLNLSYYTAIRTMLKQEGFNWQAIHDSIIKWVGSEAYATAITNKWQDLWNNGANPITPSGYVYCTNEGGYCGFSGSATIAFGANGVYTYKNLTGGTDCNNNVFGDPISGVQKSCYINGGGPVGYTFCASENQRCNVPALANVAYGASLTYLYKNNVTGGVDCNSATFGGDPISGIAKGCYYQLQNAPPILPTTPSSPTPADNATLERDTAIQLNWNTTGTSCTVHLWGGEIDINPSGNCSGLFVGNQRGGAYSWQVTASNSSGSTQGPIWHLKVKPYPATNLTATTQTDKVTLSWTLSSDEPSNVDSYNVYYSNGNLIGSTNKGVSGYTVSGLTCNTAYSFYVRSVRQGVLSNNSNTYTATTAGCIPATPSNFRVTGSTQSSITMAWSDTSNETGYKIYEWNGINFYLTHSLGANTTSFTDTGLGCGAKYAYELSAYNTAGESTHAGWIEGATTDCPVVPSTPSIPSDFRVTGSTQSSITMAWSDTSNETGYKIYEWNGIKFYLTHSLEANTTSFTDTGLNCGVDYFYELSAYNTSGESIHAGWIEGATSDCPVLPDTPSIPSDFRVTGSTQSSITLAWSDTSNETGYHIYEWNGTEPYLTHTLGANTTHYTDTGLDCGTEYAYALSAYNAAGEAGHAGWIEGATSDCPVMPANRIIYLPIIMASPKYQTVPFGLGNPYFEMTFDTSKWEAGPLRLGNVGYYHLFSRNYPDCYIDDLWQHGWDPSRFYRVNSYETHANISFHFEIYYRTGTTNPAFSIIKWGPNERYVIQIVSIDSVNSDWNCFNEGKEVLWLSAERGFD